MCYPKPKQEELESYLKMRIRSAQRMAEMMHPNNPQKAYHCICDNLRVELKNDPKCQSLIKNAVDESIAEKFTYNPYSSPACDVVTTVGASAGFYSSFPKVSHPIIFKHYGDIYFRYGKTIGKIGIIGDFFSTIGVVINLTENPSSVENWTDSFFTITGFVPVYGDFMSLL